MEPDKNRQRRCECSGQCGYHRYRCQRTDKITPIPKRRGSKLQLYVCPICKERIQRGR